MNAQHPIPNPRVLLGISMLLCAALIVGCQEIPVASNADDVAATETIAAAKKCDPPPCGGGGGGGGEKSVATIDFPATLTTNQTVPNAVTSMVVQTNVEVFKDNATTQILQGTEGLESVRTSRNFANTLEAAMAALHDKNPTFNLVGGEEVCRLFVPKRTQKKLTRQHVADALAFLVVPAQLQSSLWVELDKQATSDGVASDGNKMVLVTSGPSPHRSSDIVESPDVFPEAGAPRVTVLSGPPFSGITTYRFHAGYGVAKIIANPADLPKNFAVHCRLKDQVDFIVNLNP